MSVLATEVYQLCRNGTRKYHLEPLARGGKGVAVVRQGN